MPRDSAVTPAQGSTSSHILCPGTLARQRTPLGNRRSRRAAPARSLMVPAHVCHEAKQFLEYPIRQASNEEQNLKSKLETPSHLTLHWKIQLNVQQHSSQTSLTFFFPATGVRIRWAQLSASSTASCAPSNHGHRHNSRRVSTFSSSPRFTGTCENWVFPPTPCPAQL